MITSKIQSLFQFVDFLHSKKEYFKKYNELVNEIYLIREKQDTLNSLEKYSDRQEYNNLQKELEGKMKVIMKKVILPIRSKAAKLNIFDNQTPETLYNWNITEVEQLKTNFSNSDIEIIMSYGNKYLEYKMFTECYYFEHRFFENLDRILIKLFDYFRKSDVSQFEKFKLSKNSIRNLGETDKGEEYLKGLEAAFNNDEDYRKANCLINKFFTDDNTEIEKPIFVKSGNIKKLAFALGETWRMKNNDPITYEYLRFYKKTFSIFKKQQIDKKNLFGCNLYKYSISRT